MASTGAAVNEFEAGPFNSELAPETYVEITKGHAFLREIFQIFKRSFITPSDESQQFLDIGCGTGDFTRDWILPSCEPCKRIVAVDISESMLKYARDNYAHEKIAYERLDIDDDVSAFLKKHGAFHRVYSFRTLQWSRDLSGALRNIADLLVPGGECLLQFIARKFLFETFRELSHLEPWSKYADVLLRSIPQSQDILDKKDQHAYVSAALSSAGLVPYTTEVLTNSPASPSSPDFPKGMFLIANPIYSLLSEEEKRALLETLSTKLPEWYASYRKKCGPIEATLFVVHARKPEF